MSHANKMSFITLRYRSLVFTEADHVPRSTTTPVAPSRPKRISNGTTTASIQRSSSGPFDDRRQSIKLTVKAPPSKLREVMRPNEVEALQDTLGGGKVIDGPRSRRAAPPPARTMVRTADRPKYAEYGESDIEDDEEDDPEEEEDADGDEDEEVDDFSKLGAEPEGDSDEDEDMEDAPPPPPFKQHAPPKPPKITFKPARNDVQQPSAPKFVVTQPQVGQLKSV